MPKNLPIRKQKIAGLAVPYSRAASTRSFTLRDRSLASSAVFCADSRMPPCGDCGPDCSGAVWFFFPQAAIANMVSARVPAARNRGGVVCIGPKSSARPGELQPAAARSSFSELANYSPAPAGVSMLHRVPPAVMKSVFSASPPKVQLVTSSFGMATKSRKSPLGLKT